MPKEPCEGHICASPDELRAMAEIIRRSRGALQDLRSILKRDVCCMCPSCPPFDKMNAAIARGLGEETDGLDRCEGCKRVEALEESLNDALKQRDEYRAQRDSLDKERDALIDALAEFRANGERITEGLKQALEDKLRLETERDEAVAAVTGMRGTVEQLLSIVVGYLCNQDSCPRIGSGENPIKCSGCDIGQAKEAGEAALATTLGADILQRIRNLEKDNAHLRSVIEDATHVRPAVLWFATQMEARLKANDHKGGWERSTDEYLLAQTEEELEELTDAVGAVANDVAYEIMSFGERGDRDGLAGLIAHLEAEITEAADLANYSMMLADNAKRSIDAHLKGGGKR